MTPLLSAKLKGYAASNVLAMTLMGISKLLVRDSGILIFAEFIIIPMLMGITTAYFLRNRTEFRTRQMVGSACINGLIGIVLSALLLHEGAICLVIVSPLLFIFIFLACFRGVPCFTGTMIVLTLALLDYYCLYLW